MSKHLLERSQELFLKVRMGEVSDELKRSLCTESINQFHEELNTDSLKKAFWINVYNAFSYWRLTEKPDTLKSRVTRGKHFTARVIHIAEGKKLSLDDIEHGILRKASPKGSFDAMLNRMRFSHLKLLMVDELDSRVHFALNCGGAGCPAIRYYEAANINEQLESAKEIFIEGESSFDQPTNTLTLSQIFNWYQKDFGGEKGIRHVIDNSEQSPPTIDYKISYKPYDWTLDLENIG